MAKSYKRANGLITQRTSGGRFRKTTLKDFGVNDANEKGLVFICNVCEREFIPVVLSGHCCGVDDKRLKEIVLTKEQQELVDKIDEIKKKPFINRQMLEEIQELQRSLNSLTLQINKL